MRQASLAHRLGEAGIVRVQMPERMGERGRLAQQQKQCEQRADETTAQHAGQSGGGTGS